MRVKYNKSKTYLLPLLSELVTLDKRFIGQLVNTYLFDMKGEYENCIFILHDFNFKDAEFTKYENELVNNELFVDLIDVDKQVIYIFKFPEIYMKEYKLLVDSKYSQFDNDSKELILEFWGHMYANNISAIPFLTKLKQVLFRDKKLKEQIESKLQVKLPEDAELGDLVDKSDETLYINILDKEHDKSQNKKI